ncbi:MAG: hypothetical protein B7Z73_09395 [Planctomycetia bacterium 21-64-5]|nr:MAG: hypothetical protein B7Z73_09395 [Planctomycetia bacterium 21-64-5]
MLTIERPAAAATTAATLTMGGITPATNRITGPDHRTHITVIAPSIMRIMPTTHLTTTLGRRIIIRLDRRITLGRTVRGHTPTQYRNATLRSRTTPTTMPLGENTPGRTTTPATSTVGHTRASTLHNRASVQRRRRITAATRERHVIRPIGTGTIGRKAAAIGRSAAVTSVGR